MSLIVQTDLSPIQTESGNTFPWGTVRYRIEVRIPRLIEHMKTYRHVCSAVLCSVVHFHVSHVITILWLALSIPCGPQ